MNITDPTIRSIVAYLDEGEVEHRTLSGTDPYGTDWVAVVVSSPERTFDTLRVWTDDNVLHIAKGDGYGVPTGADHIAITNPSSTIARAVFDTMFITHLI